MNLIIKRDKWARGLRKGSPQLLNDQGNMCCLGFLALDCGYTPEDIEGVGTLSTLAQSTEAKGKVSELLNLIDSKSNMYMDSTLTSTLMRINDKPGVSETVREEALTQEFKKAGVEVSFE